MAADYVKYLLVAPPTGRLRDASIRCAIEQGFLKDLHVQLNVSQWRHVVQAVHQEHLKILVEALPTELQAGHSVETGSMLYARSSQDLPDFSDRQGRLFRAMSVAHQHLLGLSLNVNVGRMGMTATPSVKCLAPVPAITSEQDQNDKLQADEGKPSNLNASIVLTLG